VASEWHARLTGFEAANRALPEAAWPENASCRRDLRGAQEHLRVYAVGFARLAGVRDAEAMMAHEERKVVDLEAHTAE
jgi:hypothetical protein